MGFKKHTLFEHSPSRQNIFPTFSLKSALFRVLVAGSAILIFFYAQYLIAAAKSVASGAGKTAVKTVSKVFGREMVADQYGNINILILGYGGKGHNGAYLSDSIMVASFDKKLGSVSFLSLPRDMLVIKPNKEVGKLNGYLAQQVAISDTFDQAALATADKIGSMLGMEIYYYAMIDFEGFEKLVDTLGGITVDVPVPLVDYLYPVDRNGTYTTFRMGSGLQNMNGVTALQYARSRHSTSDFSRSRRQQQVIKAIFEKLTATENLTNMSKLRELYDTFTQMVMTNVTFQESVGMMKYAYQVKNYFSNGFTSECGYGGYKMMKAGCFLYTPDQELVGGASALIPVGATAGNVAFYKYMQNFAFFVMHNQGYQAENPTIEVINGIGKNAPKSNFVARNGLAVDIAVKLKKYGFNIIANKNLTTDRKSDEHYEKTTIVINGTGSTYPETLKMIKLMVNYDEVVTGALLEDGVDMQLILGNSYILDHGNARFNPHM